MRPQHVSHFNVLRNSSKKKTMDFFEVESWMNEKRAALESDNYGQDEDAAQKLLAKHRALQNDMQTYRQWLDKLAIKCTELVDSRRPNVERFEIRQKELESEFDRLSRLAEERRRALEDTVHLFEYMRESADLEQWINEQLQTAMSEEYGDDYEHFKELQSRFEEFKQSVKTGSERFVSCEAAANALLRRNPPFGRDILKKQEKLRSVWTLLLDYIESRESKLAAAEELHRFNQDVLEHEEWVADKRANMSRDKGRNMQQAKSLSQKHETLEKEVAGMEPQLQKLLAESARLKEAYPGGNAEHIAQQQMELAESWQELLHAIDDRRDELRAARDMHRFNADVRDLLAWADITIADMQSEMQVNGLQQAEGLQKEHSRLRGEITARAPEFEKVKQSGEAMIQRGHFDSHNIAKKVHQVNTAFDRLRSEWDLRDSYLIQLVQWHALQQEANQILTLIASKRATLRQLAVGGSVADVEGQKKRLDTFAKALSTLDERTKVHDALSLLHRDVEQRSLVLNDAYMVAAFDRDVADTEAWIDEKLKGIRLEKERQVQCTSIEDKMKRLQKHQALEAELAANRKRVDQVLQRGKELHAKHRDAGVDRVMSWAHERELMVTAGEMGRDLEHCKLLIDRLDGTKADSSVDEQTLEQINRLGEKLIGQGRTSREEVQQQQQNLNHTWNSLHGKLAAYRRELAAALEVHAFNRDVDDTNERIHEKIAAMRSDDYGRDFATVDALLRKQTALERDMSAIHQKLIAHDKDAQNILAKKPPLKHTILDSLKKLEESWKELSQAAELRNENLDKSYKLYKYIDQVKKAEQWAAQLRNKMTSYQQPKTSAEAEQLIAQHAERRAEIDGRQDELHVLHDEGQRLISEQPEHKPEVQRAHKRVQNSEHQLRQTWEAEKASLQRMLEWLQWCDQAAMCERWLADKENLLKQGDIGDAPDVVQMLIKSHDAFEETVRKQSEKLENLKADAAKLITSDNEYRGDVEARCEEVMQRHAAMLDSAAKRRGLLCDSKKYHEFIRTCGELITWINAKLQLANDESYLDPTNLRAKLQKHLAFDSELTENEKRLVAVEAQGEQLIKERHFMSEQSELGSDDHGRDLVSVEHLMKKLDALDAEIRKAREIKTLGSPTSDAILGAAEQVDARFSSLNEPVLIRRENLRDAHALYEWTACAEEELEWLADRLPLARSQECGDSLHAAHSLQKKHMALEKELESRQAGIHEIESKGLAMVRAKHFAAPQIEKMIDSLTSALLSVKDAASVRRARLQHAVDSHEYYTEAAEAEQWIKDQMLVAINQETGRDQASAEGYLRRLTVLDKEVAQFKKELDRLRARCDSLQDHQDANQIAARQAKLETAYADLVNECNRRRTQLVDAGRYHRFVRQVDDLSDWLHEKEHEYRELMQWMKRMQTAMTSEQLPRDVIGCEALARRHDEYNLEMQGRKPHIDEFTRQGKHMIQGGHVLSQEINEKVENLERSWAVLCEVWKDRNELYNENLDCQRWKQNAAQLEQWLLERERLLGDDWRHIESVENAEANLRDFDDFLVTLDAQGDRCEMVERTRIAEEDQRRRDTIKVVEKGQILANRRQERERRKTQEISLLRPSSNDDFSSSTLPRKLDRAERSKTTAVGDSVVVGGPATVVASAVNASHISAVDVDMRKTPSFTTRRGNSVSRNSTSRWEDLGAIDMRGFVDRKQDLQSGSKRATIRSWKNYYTILCGQLMCFFKDESSFYENIAAAPPVYIYGARCEPFPEYVKRKHAFRLATQDGAEYIFACSDERQMLEWVAKVKFHADLAPSNQLKSYAYHAAEATPLPPMRRYDAGSRSSDELPPMPMRRSIRDDTSRPISRVSAFDAYDGAQQNSAVRSSAGQCNEYNSLPRGASMAMETSIRLCSTLPRGPRSGQPIRVDSFNSLNSSSSNMPVLFEPRKATVARRPSRRQSIYAESIYGDMDEVVEVVEAVEVIGSCAAYLLAPCWTLTDTIQ
ncbi:spectrin repeat-containing domain protein [Teladorsagia circumcincta]|uniref:Spectrin repeat-containing domain protein n=1 Tax=Teladorsagia circumcincta TaxID=45464 RepID=A0A2G9UL46_TELCI|nr:spectrin repeat-containing domain protein [Teladorsagia circumcincta]